MGRKGRRRAGRQERHRLTRTGPLTAPDQLLSTLVDLGGVGLVAVPPGLAAISAAIRGTPSWPSEGAALARARRAARLLGAPVAGVGEVAASTTDAALVPMGRAESRRGGRLRVIDLSALWAGPPCGAVLAAAIGRSANSADG